MYKACQARSSAGQLQADVSERPTLLVVGGGVLWVSLSGVAEEAGLIYTSAGGHIPTSHL